jgi:demethylmenaquinone methyltransferase/2-methoxy-6-polyprenyl-1,4-benzoquinol methylase
VRFRRWYYNIFSSFYDEFVRLHSHDTGEAMRAFLVETAMLNKPCTAIDLCTGTGSSALRMAQEDGVRVIGIDFSEGMLRQASRKSPPNAACFWIQADATALPIRSCSVDRVTCAYAMYELSGDARERVLREAARILKPEGVFIMMEHLPPARRLIRLLYLIRIYLLGTRGVRSFAGSEGKELERFFERIGTAVAPGGRTKAVFGFRA